MTVRSDTRAEILAAAERQFALHGYRGTSTRSIAESVGLSQPVINYHFDSKAALFEEALELSVDRLIESVMTVLRRLRSEEIGADFAFREICRRMLDAQTTNRLIRSLNAHDNELLGLQTRAKATTVLRHVTSALGDDSKTAATVFMTMSSLSDLSAMTEDQRATYGIDPQMVIDVAIETIVPNNGGLTAR